jgi:hypothetical protein
MTVSDYQICITSTFLTHCSPDKAYEWLSAQAMASKESQGGFAPSERGALEELLLGRKNRLIDLGLAQFAYSSHVLRTVFARGDVGVRCAVLANPFLPFYSLLQEIVMRGNRCELEALALNAHLPDEFYEHLINRTEYFAELDESNYKFMLYHLGDNARLSTPYDRTIIDGWSEYRYDEVFTAAWRLCTTVPATQEWAAVLEHLLQKAHPPVGLLRFEEDTSLATLISIDQGCWKSTFAATVQQVIERWSIDPPREEDDRYYNPDYAFYLRSRLADLLEADEQLLNSPDLALRQSFYRRFSPWEFKNWPEFLEKDGEEFVEEAIRGNEHLWRSSEERYRLERVAWDCPDPHSDTTMPNLYRWREKSLREEHPGWFHDEDDEYSTDPSAVVRRMEQLLKSMDEKLENLVAVQERSLKRWWR